MSSFQPSGFWGKTLQVYLLLLKSFWIKRPFSHPCRRPSDKGLESHVMHKALGSGKGHPAEQLVEMHGSEGLRSPGCTPHPAPSSFTSLDLGGSSGSTQWVLLLACSGFFPSASLVGNLAVLCFNPKIYGNSIATQRGKKIFNVKAVYVTVFCFLLLFKLFASKSWFPEWFKRK